MPKRSRPSRLTSSPRPATTISRPVSLARVESARLSASAKRRAAAWRRWFQCTEALGGGEPEPWPVVDVTAEALGRAAAEAT